MSTQLRFVKCVASTAYPLSITPGQYYQVLPDPAEVDGMIRIVDNTGEDYLFETDLFEAVADLSNLLDDLTLR
jgi:hypothetical protein